jgi:outer membrane protein insertion porin family
VNFEKNRQVLQNRLENRGFFSTTVSFDTTAKNRKMSVAYHVNAKPQYKIRSVKFPSDSSELSKAIARVTRRSRLKVGDPYDLDVIKDERLRIDSRLKNQGFFYYNEDDLIINVDSTVGENKVDLVVEIKPQTPPAARSKYHVNDVTVYADYTLDTDTAKTPQGIRTKEGYFIIDPQKKYNPKIFSRTLVFDTGAVYRREDHNLSLSRLVDLGVFKFVKVRFDPADTGRGNGLNAFYYLTPTKKKSARAEVSALTKSNSANGTEFTLSWRNRNLFKGAELFTISAFIGFERQSFKADTLAGKPRVTYSNNTVRYGADLNLFIPRIIAPFRFRTNSSFVPKTRANLGYEVFSRSDQYKLNTFRGSLGYVWKENVSKEHQLNILNINYVQPLSIDPAFQRRIDTNTTLARSIEQQFIIGSNYNFNYNSQAVPNRKRNNFYFNGNVDLSGNILGLVTGADVLAGKRKEIFGSPFSQYARLELEGRHYFRLSKVLRRNSDNMIASRMILGYGYAYGNSTTMPFIKQFFIGGTNSIRAWRARSLGPGRYDGTKADKTGFLPDQPGDVKIEVNTELRFKIVSIMQGALFVDAGNIWDRRGDTSRPGSKFTSKFLSDFAVGTGAGVRFDIRLLVLRLDVGVPVRKPYEAGGPKWDLDLSRPVFNLAIGYPF